MHSAAAAAAATQHLCYPVERIDDALNATLCNELLADVLCRLPQNLDRQNIPLVCKRWLQVQRMARTGLRLYIPNDNTLSCFLSSIHLLLKQHPHVASLIVSSQENTIDSETLDVVVAAIASACKFLTELHFTAGSVNFLGLQRLANGCPAIVSLSLWCLPVKYLPLLGEFKVLRELSLKGYSEGNKIDLQEAPYQCLQIECLSLERISASNSGLGWLWRSCSRLTKLQFFNCEGIGDVDASSFIHCLQHLNELQLHMCRTIASRVLMLVAQYCTSLRALTFHNGGETEGLKQVLRRCQGLEVLDLRLPLDLDSDDLAAIAWNCRALRTLRLHSCWVSGVGMRFLAAHIKSDLEELVLVECKALQDSGTLCTLGQHLRSIKSLDLSENDQLPDKELVGILASCQELLHLRLGGCRRLTNRVIEFISQRCTMLQSIDIRGCDEISSMGVSTLLSGCLNLKNIGVERRKVTDEARNLAFIKGFSFVGTSSSHGRTKIMGPEYM